jgi:hypothetical protein
MHRVHEDVLNRDEIFVQGVDEKFGCLASSDTLEEEHCHQIPTSIFWLSVEGGKALGSSSKMGNGSSSNWSRPVSRRTDSDNI